MYVLNTSILTEYGKYAYAPCSLERAMEIVKNNGLQSAIGHDSTARIIESLLGVACPVNRVYYSQQAGESCLIFKLKGRPEEGKILSVEEVEKIGYSWGILTRNE